LSYFRFLAVRTFCSIFVLLGLSVLVFLLARVMPGDPARLALGQRAPEDVVERFRETMHLNDPLPVQYFYWLKGFVQGDFGISFITRRPVLDEIKAALPATMELILFALIIDIVLGQLIGITAAKYSNTWIDNVARVTAYVGIVIPSFVLALFLMLLFCYVFPVLPTTGRLSGGIAPPPVLSGMMALDSIITGNVHAFVDTVKHMVLPAFALAMGNIAQESRITRASMIDRKGADWIAFERANGISERLVFFKYLLRPSLAPTVSVMGPCFAYLVVNGFLVEVIFGWPGLSRYGMQSILDKDLNAITAVVLILGAFFAIVNMLVDLVVGWLNPNMRITAARRR